MTSALPTSYGIYEAKTHFASLIERVFAGESLTITKHGVPVARLVPLGAPVRTPEQVAEMVTAVDAFRAKYGTRDVDIRSLIGRDDH